MLEKSRLNSNALPSL